VTAQKTPFGVFASLLGLLLTLSACAVTKNKDLHKIKL